MDYDGESFDPNEYDKEGDSNDDKNNDAINYEYNKIDENELPNILK